MFKYDYEVPDQKKVRLLIHTDCKNEADDQYAVVHQLLTPKLDVRGILAAHFENGMNQRFPPGTTAQASYDEILTLLDLMGLPGACPVWLGASGPMPDAKTPVPSPAAEAIIREALRDDPRPLYIGMQGSLTDLASAILMAPEICDRMTAIWIGGGVYPLGNPEFNLMQDIHAANVVFAASMPFWQVPQNVYKQFSVTLAELQLKVKPCGKIGEYLFNHTVALNTALGGLAHWPHGEVWGLGDHGVISALMTEQERTDLYDIIPAPAIRTEDMTYIHDTGYRPIRVYHTMDVRSTLEDMFCKLRLQFGT